MLNPSICDARHRRCFQRKSIAIVCNCAQQKGRRRSTKRNTYETKEEALRGLLYTFSSLSIPAEKRIRAARRCRVKTTLSAFASSYFAELYVSL